MERPKSDAKNPQELQGKPIVGNATEVRGVSQHGEETNHDNNKRQMTNAMAQEKLQEQLQMTKIENPAGTTVKAWARSLPNHNPHSPWKQLKTQASKPKSKPPGSHCRGHSPHWLGKFEMLVEVANWKLKFCMKMEIGNWQLKWNDCSEQEGPGMINNKYKAATKIAKNTFPKNVILFVHFSWGSFVQNPFSDCYRPWAWPNIYIYMYIYIYVHIYIYICTYNYICSPSWGKLSWG